MEISSLVYVWFNNERVRGEAKVGELIWIGIFSSHEATFTLANFSASFSSDITLLTLAESLTSFPVPRLIGLPELTCSNKRRWCNVGD